MSTVDIVYVFTNYNNYLHTIKVTKSIVEFSSSSPVIIVDNDSNQENIFELLELSKKFTNVEILFNNSNIGYFKGLNIGIEHALKKYRFDLLIIGNNDLTFPITFQNDIKNKFHLFNKYAVVSPNIITLDNVPQNPHVINKISFFRHFIYDLYYSNYYLSKVILFISNTINLIFKRKDYLKSNVPQVIYQGYGACYVLGPIFFKFYNQLFAPTFLMGEEFFLAYQLKLFNLQLFYEPSIKVFHQDHASTGQVESLIFWKISKSAHKTYKKYLKSYE
jgi:hypothetical protein